MSDEAFLSRWSRRKHEARREGDSPPATAPSAPIEAVTPIPPPAEAEPPLPAVESLTPDSDFSGFMKPEVEEGLKRRALKTLFRDPHFNVMDGLDTYIDDYSKPDPLPEGWLAQLKQVARLGDYQEPKADEAGKAPESEGEAEPVQGLTEDSPAYDSAIRSDGIPPSPVKE